MALAALDLALKGWAVRGLGRGEAIDLWVIQLRLAFNPGVAFSMGDTMPTWVLLGISGLVIAGLAIYAWRSASSAPLVVRFAVAMVLGGAVANFIDRARDGVVTDYLHTGWFPTFNGADVLIVVGATTLILAILYAERERARAEGSHDPAS
ncbi:signal peptidase II [Mycolicibacterium arseniciresistens]|uniref:Lipoprotein signal peptidase n=1 Tax=Mycolicibacterium arseniciresistens TaxID=3062257 RepID=A0ABT8UK71_9MYCO|nr:signal peptidase II [Mycolicibacterium arseniciresistens]MDO3637225.1 signal peptidase II [Mycolicibacterium arseniciresistens]